MSEFRALPLDLVPQDQTPEQLLAQESYCLLWFAGERTEEEIDETSLVTSITERCDMIGRELGRLASLRIRGVPTFALVAGESAARPASEYFVMALQYGEAYDVDETLDDDDFEWEDRAIIVSPMKKPTEVSVLNADNGKPLDTHEVEMLNFLVTNMRQNFNAMQYENTLPEGSDIAPEIVTEYDIDDSLPAEVEPMTRRVFENFELGSFFEGFVCPKCGPGAPCEPHSATLN